MAAAVAGEAGDLLGGVVEAVDAALRSGRSALVVFPDATEITTISLEAAGDVRAIDGIDPPTLRRDLDTIGHDIGRLYNTPSPNRWRRARRRRPGDRGRLPRRPGHRQQV